jgi:hypothetical protein
MNRVDVRREELGGRDCSCVHARKVVHSP